MSLNHQKIYLPILIGDFAAFFIITMIGFLNHNSSLSVGRFLVTFIPLCLAWLFSAPWFGLLTNQQMTISPVWWKVIWAVLLSTPLALLMRALLLNSSVQVSFALIMVFTSIVALLVWRLIWFFVINRKR